ncbi:bifunctional DNA primase/polymerase [Pseudonocardia yunnanensis]|uniref:Bifunctional DNA primase/polymerase n=1 Tax=Pseudonocardia yunnanensis TaxID=58107 RepID=A0ABW4EL46_9PSEU
MTAASDLLDVALATAARGWPVIPLVPGGKRPALHGIDHCASTGVCAGGHQGWEQRATCDPQRIRRAWSTGPFNVGIACGPAGLVVIDLDTIDPDDPEDVPPAKWMQLGITSGADVLAVLAERAGQPMPATRTVDTPSGGRHLYFLAPDGPAAPALRNTSGARGNGLGWKIDTRAHGGQVVAAGSRTPDGVYRLVDAREPVPLPGWLLQRLRPAPPPPIPAGPVHTGHGRRARYLAAAITAETARVHNAAAGQRNACLYVASVALGQLVAGGTLPEADARAALISAAGRHLALRAYSPRQAEQTITSGLRAGARRPRRVEDAA